MAPPPSPAPLLPQRFPTAPRTQPSSPSPAYLPPLHQQLATSKKLRAILVPSNFRAIANQHGADVAGCVTSWCSVRCTPRSWASSAATATKAFAPQYSRLRSTRLTDGRGEVSPYAKWEREWSVWEHRFRLGNWQLSSGLMQLCVDILRPATWLLPRCPLPAENVQAVRSVAASVH